MEETIVAPATPAGRGGVAIVRISGTKAKKIGESLCKRLPDSWQIIPCSIYDKTGGVVDGGLVAFFQSPKSYTGEDVVEIHCHGNPVIVDLIVASAVSFGARVADPGEFTKRAFLNDKIDLAQAESVADLIGAESIAAARGALSSLVGSFSAEVSGSIERLLSLRVLLEAGLDFPEEEGVPGLDKNLEKVAKGVTEELSFVEKLIKESKSGIVLRSGLKVVILGPPNCGKSTLLNYLAKEDLAIVSSSPGTTRDPIRGLVSLLGLPVSLVDTAGVRTKGVGSVEKEGIKRTEQEVSQADLVFVMSEVGVEFKPVGVEASQAIRVFNKIDLVDKGRDLKKQKGAVYLSAKTGEGVDLLVKRVHGFVGSSHGIEVPFLARRRHLSLLREVKESLSAAALSLGSGSSPELVVEDIKSAQNSFGQIMNPISSDDVLGKIFSEFCVGK